MQEAHIYHSETNQYLTVENVHIMGHQHTLAGTHKFFPGNQGDKFMVDGYTFQFPKAIQVPVPGLQERVAFMKRNGTVTELVAVGIVNRIEAALTYSLV